MEGTVWLHLNDLLYIYTEVSGVPHKTDLPVIRSLLDLYTKSNFCINCSASYRVQVKGEQSLQDINKESINKVEVKCVINCVFKRLIIF